MELFKSIVTNVLTALLVCMILWLIRNILE